MRSKNILSIAAFAVAFSLSTVLASFFVVKSYQTTTYGISEYSSTCSKRRNLYQSSTAKKITAFISEDVENGRDRDRKIYANAQNFRPAFESSIFPVYVEAVEEYVDASSAMDTKVLPRDLQNAWDEHMKTWQDYSAFLNEMKPSSARKNMDLEELLEADDQHSVEINRTWFEVLQTAEAHGADVY